MEAQACGSGSGAPPGAEWSWLAGIRALIASPRDPDAALRSVAAAARAWPGSGVALWLDLPDRRGRHRILGCAGPGDAGAALEERVLAGASSPSDCPWRRS
jgi:hypothetical protein